MNRRELDRGLADLGLTEDGLARLIGVDVAQVKRWRSGEQPIPDWAPMALSLLSEFREGARIALQKKAAERERAATGPDPAAAESGASKAN